ncbi:MAG: site-specific DNA-methyltransferase, partial [Ardenticatenales bacterium]
MAAKPAPRAPIASIQHQDTRLNIPTEELRDFVAAEEAAPQTLLYPRDPSLDPQLVWKGKDDQDRAGLAVPLVPIYIQEKIHPRALIEDLRRHHPAAGRIAEPEGAYVQADLFATAFDEPGDFNHLVDFYQHDQHWSNRLILGDSLQVMASLAEKEGLKGKVQTIYLDPPYGIKFGSNWQVSTRKRDVKDGKVEDATREPEQIRAFRDTWQLGIHSYLAYLRDRLVVARELLTETGSVFVQIGDENVHLVRSVMDEVFGSENFVSLITFRKTSGASSELLAGVSDYLVWFAHSIDKMKYRQLYHDKSVGGLGGGQYTWIEHTDGTRQSLGSRIGEAPPGSRVLMHDNLTSQRPPGDFPIEFSGRTFRPGRGYWKTGPDGFERLGHAKRLMLIGNTLRYVRFLDDFPVFPINNSWTDTVISGFGAAKSYVVQTTTTVVERAILMTTDPGDLVLDPTCGSGT